MKPNLTQVWMAEMPQADLHGWMGKVQAALLNMDVERPATWMPLETLSREYKSMVRLVELLRVHCPVPDCRVPTEAGCLVLAACHPDNRSLGYVLDVAEAYIREKDREGILFLCRMQAIINANGDYTHLNFLYNRLTGYLLACRRKRLEEYRKGIVPLWSETDLQTAEKYLPHLRGCSFSDRVVTALPKVKSVEELARECGCALNTFERHFKEEFGETPHRWLTKQKVRRIRSLLTDTDMAFQEIASVCGFVSDNYLWDFCKKHLGATPVQIREMAYDGE